jgi:hypothetical protein
MKNSSAIFTAASPLVQGVKGTKQQAATRRMWNGGPLRQFSEAQVKSHYVAYCSPILTGYAGSYICDGCQEPCAGVYLVRPFGIWLCGACKKGSLPDNSRRKGRAL